MTIICPHCDAPIGVPELTDVYDVHASWVGCDVCGLTATVTVTVEGRVAQQPDGVASFTLRPVA
jgi:hypothetical protein